MSLSIADASARSEIAALQARFVAALREPGGAVPCGLDGAKGASRLRRFNVYRNTVHASLVSALAARFPVVARLVGADFFQAAALAFIREEPPCSPVLARYGGTFAAFLERFGPAADLPFLGDVARLEFGRCEAFHARDEHVLEIASLGGVPDDELGEVHLVIHPAVRLVRSRFPVFSIWQTNTHDEVVTPIALDAGAEAALVTRPQLDVRVSLISYGAALLLEGLGGGLALGEAAAACDASEADFDLADALARLFAAGAFAGLRRPPLVGIDAVIEERGA